MSICENWQTSSVIYMETGSRIAKTILKKAKLKLYFQIVRLIM